MLLAGPGLNAAELAHGNEQPATKCLALMLLLQVVGFRCHCSHKQQAPAQTRAWGGTGLATVVGVQYLGSKPETLKPNTLNPKTTLNTCSAALSASPPCLSPGSSSGTGR